MQNAPREHSAILSTCIKLPSIFKTFVLPSFEWPLKKGFAVVKVLVKFSLFCLCCVVALHPINKFQSFRFNQSSVEDTVSCSSRVPLSHCYHNSVYGGRKCIELQFEFSDVYCDSLNLCLL